MYVCVCLGLCMREKRLQRPGEGIASLGLEFQVVVSGLMQVSGMKLQVSARAAHALNCRASSPALEQRY